MSTMLPMGPVATTVTGQTFQVMQPSTGNVYDLTAGTTTGQYVGVSASGVFGLMTFNPLQLTVVSSTTQTGALTAGAMNYITYAGNCTYTAPIVSNLASGEVFGVCCIGGTLEITYATNQYFFGSGAANGTAPTKSTTSTGNLKILAPGATIWFIQMPTQGSETVGGISVVNIGASPLIFN